MLIYFQIFILSFGVSHDTTDCLHYTGYYVFLLMARLENVSALLFSNSSEVSNEGDDRK